MDSNELMPKKPIVEMTDDEFDAWRAVCRDACSVMSEEQLNAALGEDNVKAAIARSSDIDDDKITKIVSYMRDLRANTNECVMAAAVGIAMQLEGAPEDVCIKAVENFPTKLEMALASFLTEPELDKNLS